MKLICIAFSLCLLTSLISCKVNKNATLLKASKNESNTILDYAKEKYEKAMVFDASEVAGCGFGILLENGNRLQPKNLSSEFKKDSLQIWVKYIIENVPSACQMGKVVQVSAIQKR